MENCRYQQQRRNGCAKRFNWFPLGRKGKWNLEQRDGTSGDETELQLSLLGSEDDIAEVGFPYFGGEGTEHFSKVELENILLHKLPVKRLQLADGSTALVTTVYDLTMANYGTERGLNDENCATSYDDVKAYTPAWAEKLQAYHVLRLYASPVNLRITQIKRTVVR